MKLDFASIFRGSRIPVWLEAFAADPDAALHNLLTNRAELGHLAVADPVELLLGWLKRFNQQPGFGEQVDAGLETWIRHNWGLFELENAANSATLTAAAWIRASELLAANSDLTRAGDRLRQYVIHDPRYLNSLCEGRSRDPQASALLAIATHQRDRSLLPTWWQLCDISPDQPWYRGHCAIAGLRALPAKSKALEGGFPKEVAEGLNRFGLALLRLQEEGWLMPALAAEEFQDSLRLCRLAYPFAEKWLSFWRHALARDSRQGDLTPWVIPQFPKLANANSQAQQPKNWASFDSSWPERTKQIAELLGKNDPGAEQAAEQLLGEQARYRDASGYSGGLARAATRLSKAARDNQPELALKWARLAKQVEPWNGFGWNNEVSSLQALGDLPAAWEAALETKARFPNDVFARNGLAEVLKSLEWFDEAEAEYRETKARFPNNVVARTGLANVLKALERFDEAEAEYREIKARFPNDVVVRSGLAEVLKSLERFDEAEAEYRETKARFPDNVFARSGLAEVLKSLERFDEAEAEYRETKARFPNDVVVRNGLAEVLKSLKRFDEAEAEYRETKARFPNDVFARSGLAEVLKSLERFDEAEAEYRETKARFPNNIIARTGLAGVRVAQNRLEEAELEYREALKQAPNNAIATAGLVRVLQALGRADEIETVKKAATSNAAQIDTLQDQQPSNTHTAKNEQDGHLTRRDIEILATDAYLIRGWARTSKVYDPNLPQGKFRERAEALLAQLMPSVDSDPLAAGELALLNLDRGDIEQGLILLHRAVQHFPGSARVRYALARAERETGQGNPVISFRRLLRMDEHFEPVYYLGAGRALLAQAEQQGHSAEEKARDHLGRLAYWIQQCIEPRPGCDMNDPKANPRWCFQAKNGGGFDAWWALETQATVFGRHQVSGYDDLVDFDPIKQRIADHAPMLNSLEEDYVRRFANA
jgi:Flp pilus assembly protein TadD